MNKRCGRAEKRKQAQYGWNHGYEKGNSDQRWKHKGNAEENQDFRKLMNRY